jgi:hypothetical protein
LSFSPENKFVNLDFSSFMRLREEKSENITRWSKIFSGYKKFCGNALGAQA